MTGFIIKNRLDFDILLITIVIYAYFRLFGNFLILKYYFPTVKASRLLSAKVS